MRLNKEAIEEFKEIYKREFGKTISDEKAQELGQNLISLFKIIYRPIPVAKESKNNEIVQKNKKP
ncbi:MAG: hypothetical protein ACUVQ9_11910 [Thermodesulfobacteriota bacterium]